MVRTYAHLYTCTFPTRYKRLTWSCVRVSVYTYTCTIWYVYTCVQQSKVEKA